MIVYVVLVVVIALPSLACALLLHSRWCEADVPLDQSLVKFTDAEFEREWRGKKIPILIMYDAYFAGKVDIEGDMLEALYRRLEFTRMIFTWGHVQFFLGKLIPELLAHTRAQDVEQVTDHYDRGNDFYNAFLGEMMIYTSAIFNDPEETLEQAQHNKLELVAQKIHLKEGEKHLDIGCGWGTLVNHFAKNYKTDSLGVTLAKEQVAWAEACTKKLRVGKLARFVRCDYRDIPRDVKFDKITCLEMAEHVGIKYFQKFLLQVRDMMTDDGIFFLQIAGLRRAMDRHHRRGRENRAHHRQQGEPAAEPERRGQRRGEKARDDDHARRPERHVSR